MVSCPLVVRAKIDDGRDEVVHVGGDGHGVVTAQRLDRQDVACGLAADDASQSGQAAHSPAQIERAQAAADRAGAQLRVPLTSTEELGVTHLFAARGYDTIVAIDLDRHVSVDPVAERYPGVRFTDRLP